MFKKIKVLNGNLSLHLKAMAWHIENKSNVLSVFSASPEIIYRVPIKEKFHLVIYGDIRVTNSSGQKAIPIVVNC